MAQDGQKIANDLKQSFSDAVENTLNPVKGLRTKASNWWNEKSAAAREYLNKKTTVSAKEDGPKSQTRKVTTAKTAAASRKPVTKKTVRKTTTKR